MRFRVRLVDALAWSGDVPQLEPAEPVESPKPLKFSARKSAPVVYTGRAKEIQAYFQRYYAHSTAEAWEQDRRKLLEDGQKVAEDFNRALAKHGS